MRYEAFYPSKYLAAADLLALEKPEVTVTIDYVVEGEVESRSGKAKKLLLKFKEYEKPMVLNRTNAKVIARNYGPEIEGWANARITIYPAEVEFAGEQVMALRIRPTVPLAAKLTLKLDRIDQQRGGAAS